MIKLGGTGTIETRVRDLERSINFSEKILAFPAVGSVETFGTTGTSFGGVAVDRSVFRKLLPDARWIVYAAGIVNATDANGAILSLVYVKDDMTEIALGAIGPTGAGRVKVALGPFEVYPTAGVPQGETIPVIRLRALKSVSGTGTVETFVIWLRLVAPRQS